MKLFTVYITRNGTVALAETAVIKETAQFYFIDYATAKVGYSAPFGYSNRVNKSAFATTVVAALARYIERRMTDCERARAVIDQASYQIHAAETLLAAARSSDDA